MMVQMYPVIVISFFFFSHTSQECIQKKVSCNDIETKNGFNFLHAAPERSKISVFKNKTLIAYAVPSEQLVELTHEVTGIDNSSVITRNCQDLRLELLVPNGPLHIKDICLDFKITDTIKYPDPNDSSSQEDRLPAGVITGVIILVIAITGIIVMCVLWFVWSRRKQNSGATVLQFIHLPACLRTEVSQAETEEQETRGLSSVPEQHGSDEIHVNIDALTDGETLQSVCLDQSLSSEGIQTTNNDDISSHDVNRASNQLTMYRNMRDDPGGVNDNKGEEILRETRTGWTHGDRGREGHENEEQPLLVNPRAAIQGFDRTGEAAVLVNMHGFDQDQVSSSSTAPQLPRLLPDADVESTPDLKNCTQT